MKRILTFGTITLWPALAAADMAPEPTGTLPTDAWVVVASVALGLILAGAVWKVSSSGDDDGDNQ